MKVLAVFDFDGTITRKDTLLEFAKYCVGGMRFYLGFLFVSPVLVLYKLRIIPNWKAKEIFLRHFLGGMTVDEINEKGRSFCVEKLPALLRKDALDRIEKYRSDSNTTLVLATASANNWIESWAANESFDLISTKLEIEDQIITGKIEGENCHGKAKLKAVQALYDFSEFDEVHFYGDSHGDKAFENEVSHFHYRVF